MKRSWAGEVRNVSLLVAIAVNTEGYREILCQRRTDNAAEAGAKVQHGGKQKALDIGGLLLVVPIPEELHRRVALP
jgi:hypothetical protein